VQFLFINVLVFLCISLYLKAGDILQALQCSYSAALSFKSTLCNDFFRKYSTMFTGY